MNNTRVNWHSAMVSTLKIELNDYRDILKYESEFVLNTGQRRADLLILKAENSRPITTPIGKIFLGYNLVEYKGPGDTMSVQAFYKSLSYIYNFPEFFHHDEILCDTSLSLISHSFPQKLWKHLKNKKLHPLRSGTQKNIEKIIPGLYYINTEMIPVQLLITSQLPAEEYLWLQSLTNKLQIDRLQTIGAVYNKHQNDPEYQNYMNTLIRANRFSKGDGSSMLCDALQELFADEIEKRNLLFQKLLESNRMDDLKKSVYDESYQKKLLKEYGL